MFVTHSNRDASDLIKCSHNNFESRFVSVIAKRGASYRKNRLLIADGIAQFSRRHGLSLVGRNGLEVAPVKSVQENLQERAYRSVSNCDGSGVWLSLKWDGN
jgi:hypothetical protein